MHTSDKNIIKAFELLKEIGEVKFYEEIYKTLDITKHKVAEVKKGNQHFTTEQIQKLCEYYNINANWIFGLENNVFRK